MSWRPTAEEHAPFLRPLIGDWVRQEPAGPGGGARRRGLVTAAARLAGFFVFADYIEEEEGQVVFEGHGVLGWDRHERCHTWTWFDSLGFASPQIARGAAQGHALSFQHTSRRGEVRTTHAFIGGDIYEFGLALREEGGPWRPLLEGRYHRIRGGAAPPGDR